MALDPTDPNFVALANRSELPRPGCTLHISRDGGRGWLPLEPPVSQAGVRDCVTSGLAFDSEGTLYFLFTGRSESAPEPVGAFLVTSTDGGHTFGPPRKVLEGGRFPVEMAIEPGPPKRLHLVWLERLQANGAAGANTPARVVVMTAHSDDGNTLSSPIPVSSPAASTVAAPSVVAAADGAVYVAFYDLGDAVAGADGDQRQLSLVLASSSDRGGRFGITVVEPTIPAPRARSALTPPGIAAASGRRLHLAWADPRNGDWDVFLRSSDDGGRTWRRIQRLNDDSPGNGRHQYLPALSVSPGGRLDAIYYDRRRDPENLRAHVTYASSEDGGRKWSESERLTEEPSDSRVAFAGVTPEPGQPGFRLGLASRRHGLVAAWTDTRNATGTSAQDIFATEVRLPHRPALVSWFAAAAFLAASASIIVALVGRRERRLMASVEETERAPGDGHNDPAG